MVSVLSQRLFVAALSGGACNLWTYLHEEAAAARSSRAAEGKDMQKQIRGSLCSVRGVQGPTWTVGVSLSGKKKKKEPPSIQSVNFPSADVCSGAPTGVPSRRFISPSKRPSH